MEKEEKLYEGKAKIVYSTENPDLLIQYFKDSATAFDGKKKGEIGGKGPANATISTKLFQILQENGIPTHFHKLLNEREMLIDRLRMIPLEVIVRNICAGSLAKRFGWEEGRELKKPLVEFYYKNDELGDPMLTCGHIEEMEIVDRETFSQLKKTALEINRILKDFFLKRRINLVDFKLEFGYRGEEIVLGDEISPDSLRLWDAQTGEKLDKDRFRRDMEGVEEAYQEVVKRVTS